VIALVEAMTFDADSIPSIVSQHYAKSKLTLEEFSRVMSAIEAVNEWNRSEYKCI